MIQAENNREFKANNEISTMFAIICEYDILEIVTRIVCLGYHKANDLKALCISCT
jgi:hypothetical protein